MTELLQRLIAELEKLPEDEQDAISPLQLVVTIILEELEDEIQWDTVDYVAREA